MDAWTWEQLEKQGVDPNTVCDIRKGRAVRNNVGSR